MSATFPRATSVQIEDAGMVRVLFRDEPELVKVTFDHMRAAHRRYWLNRRVAEAAEARHDYPAYRAAKDEAIRHWRDIRWHVRFLRGRGH